MFMEIVDDALSYSKEHKLSYRDDTYRFAKIKKSFEGRSVESITVQDVERYLADGMEHSK